MKVKNNNKYKLGIIFMIFIFVFIISFSIGRYQIDRLDVLKIIANESGLGQFQLEDRVINVVMNIRRPRIISAVLVGSALATSGAVFQALFRNPMASPDLLGASSGAGFGAALGILLHLAYYKITIISFSLGILAVVLTYLISSFSKMEKTLSLVLAGIMVGSIFSSLLSVVKLLADPTDTLPSITYWLMGSLSSINQSDLRFAMPSILISLLIVFLLRWRLNLLTMGQEEASSMGVDIKRLRFVMIIAASLLTAASVSISGMIGWVGLVIPHFSRLILGNDYRYVITGSILIGGAYLLIIDNLARTLTTIEIPLGILTALVGAPFFIYLLLKGGRR